MKKTKYLIGRGVLSWNRGERVSDRYGAVSITDRNYKEDAFCYSVFIDKEFLDGNKGVKGKLKAKILVNRESGHIGDFFRGFYPKMPKVGQRITLGEGYLFFEEGDNYPGGKDFCIGLKPEDDRSSDWLKPKALYKCHDQTVELWFYPET